MSNVTDLKRKKVKIMNFVSGGDNGGVKHCFLHYQKALQSIVEDPIASVRSNFPCMKELRDILVLTAQRSFILTSTLM